MKTLLLTLLLALPVLAPAQTAHPRPRTTHHTTHRAAPRPAAGPRVYVCNGGSAYAYHNSQGCADLNRCTHTVDAVTVAEAQGIGRQPCKKCY